MEDVKSSINWENVINKCIITRTNQVETEMSEGDMTNPLQG